MPMKFTDFVLHNPKKIFLLVLVMTAITAAMIPLIQIDTDPENMLPDDQVDMLYESGRTLLRESKDFQRLLQNLRSVRH